MKIKLLLFTLAFTGLFTSELKAQNAAVLQRSVSTGNDDAEESVSSGAIDLTSSDLEIMTDGSSNQFIGIRFNTLGIPKNAIIDSAFIQFTNKGDKAPVMGDAFIKIQLADNAAGFTTTTNNISSRSVSSDSVTWAGSTDASWGTSQANAQTLLQRTPDLKQLVQQIVNRSGWNTNNAMCFILRGSGVRNTYSYNGSTSTQPKLIVYYKAYPELTYPNGGETLQAGSSLNITWNGNGISTLKIEYSANGGALWNNVVSSYPANLGYYTWTLPVTTTTNAMIRISDSANALTFDTTNARFTVTSDTLIYANANWNYKDNGSDQGTAWYDSAFNDASWSSGNAEFGYGDGGEATLVNACGTVTQNPSCTNKYITTYFRKKIFIPNLNNFNSFLIEMIRDDGAVVYVNGNEVRRDNLPAGAINYTTLAPAAIGGADETTWFATTVGTTAFTSGWNTIAVELHQNAGTSSDLSFNFRLIGLQASFTPPPPATITAPNGNQILYSGGTQQITWTQNSVAKLKIEYTVNGGSVWNTIANGISSASSPYTWTIPADFGTLGLIRISDSVNTNAFDTSNSYFSLVASPAPFNPCVNPDHIGCFTSVQPMAQTQLFRLPGTTHVFQRLIKTGDPLTYGGTLGANNDFTGYIPTGGSSKEGYLSINHETDPGGVSIIKMHFDDTTALWKIDSSGAVDFAAPGLVKTIRNCSGGVTPWGTVITSEESYNTGDANSDGYTDVGWHVEIDPRTRQVMDYNNDGIKDKLWQMGRMSHENIVLASDSITAYYAEDGGSSGLYKFVANQKGQMDSGTLYVMQRTGLTGNWILVPNATQAQCNTVSSTVAALGATNFNGAEDVEINPLNGMIYFTSKGNSLIYRFIDNGLTVSNFENYVGNASVNYSINYGSGTANEAWGSGIDNLAFDDQGNLWAQQDGSRNHLWVIRPDHTPVNPKVELFATTPAGSEPTGLTFTPDYKFAFLSFQHPSNNTSSVTDAAGNTIAFNTHSTIVLASKNVLGPLAALPVKFASFTLEALNQKDVKVNWETATEENNHYFAVERSLDGISFTEAGKVIGNGNSSIMQRYTFTDLQVPASTLYYRIRQTDYNGKSSYTDVRSITLGEGVASLSPVVYPNPFDHELHVEFTLKTDEQATITVTNIDGKVLYSSTRFMNKGQQKISVPVKQFESGVYFVSIQTATVSQVIKTVK